MGLVVTANAVVDDLKIFGSVHVETSDFTHTASNLDKRKLSQLYVIDKAEVKGTLATCSCSSLLSQADLEMR